MTDFLNKVGGLFRSHKPLERTKAPEDERPVETRAKAKRSHSLASAFSSKHKALKSRTVNTAPPNPRPTAAKISELDPAAKLNLTSDEYFSIVAYPEPKVGPVRGGQLVVPARTEAAERMLQEIEHRNVHNPKMGPIRNEPLEAPARNEATERMLLEIENREVDGELEKLIQGLNDEGILSVIDPRIMDHFAKHDPEEAGKTVHWPEPTLHWPEQLEVPAMRDFNSVASETGDAIARAEAELRDQQKVQSAYDEAVKEIAGQSQDNRMPLMERKAVDGYADFERLLKQNDLEREEDIKGDIEWDLLTSDHLPAANANAAYQDFEQMIDPNGPRALPEKHVGAATSKTTGSTDSTERDRTISRAGRPIPKPLPKPPTASTKPAGSGR